MAKIITMNWLSKRNEFLQAENERLKKENEKLKEQLRKKTRTFCNSLLSFLTVGKKKGVNDEFTSTSCCSNKKRKG